MTQVVIVHLKGSKAGKNDSFECKNRTEIKLGRDPSANVQFDPERDDLVGREHASISWDQQDPPSVQITDLSSRNGTFVNGRQVNGISSIYHSDVVMLGRNGPEFRFELSPPPPVSPKATRYAAPGEGQSSVPPTRMSASGTSSSQPPSGSAAGNKSDSIRRESVERMIDVRTSNTRQNLINTAAVVLGLVTLVGGYVLYTNQQTSEEIERKVVQNKEDTESVLTERIVKMEAARPITAAEVAAQNSSAAVYIEASWKLIDVASGQQITQRVGEFCAKYDGRGKCVESVYLPLYIQLDRNTIEPWLLIGAREGKSDLPIGGQHTGSGFVINPDGFILTNRHVAATWEATYDIRPGMVCPLSEVISGKGNCDLSDWVLLDKEAAEKVHWVPTKSQMLGGKQVSGKVVDGHHDYLDVTFAKTRLRIPARLSGISDRADVATLKIDVPQRLSAATLATDHTVNIGDPVTVMGYPGVSPKVYVRFSSQDPHSAGAGTASVPDPSIADGIVGKVIRGEAVPEGGTGADYFSEMGDVYQLTVSSTGPGNSGGPVFNSRGQVMGIFTYGSSDGRLSFAVPISYGQELLGVQPVLK